MAAWIAETEAEKAGYQLSTRATARPRMTEAQIKAIADSSPTSPLCCATPTPTTKQGSSAGWA